jgi:FixJ family two-component response regulator
MSDSPGIVFVIDDDVSIQYALGGSIRSIGLRVELFWLRGEFLNRKPSEAPACITLDIRLPGFPSHLGATDLQDERTRDTTALCILAPGSASQNIAGTRGFEPEQLIRTL